MALQKAAMVQDVPPGAAKQVKLGGRTIALFNVAGTFHAIDDACPHRGVPLSEGTVLDDCEVECGAHGARFNLATGAALCPPARSGVTRYKVEVVGDEVRIDVP